jgi:dihydroorotate dehydrogenase (fumarate)
MDLTTRYLGLELRNPIVASAGPFARTSRGVRRLADAGVGAVVLSSLFEEQLEHADDANPPGGQRRGPSEYLELIRYSVAAVDVPVIASLNGSTTGGWTDYASAMQEAGAAAIELNLYFPQADALTSGREIEQRHVEVLMTVKAAVGIPVAVKIAPTFSSPGEVALRLDHIGADGLVLFNRFMQTGIDPETLEVDSVFELSRSADAAFARTWIARLRGRVGASLAASTGVDQAPDVAAYLLAGADVVMTTSALLRHGPEHVEKLLYGLTGWMRRKGFAGLDEVRGLLADSVVRHSAGGHDDLRDREGYLTALQRATAKYSPDS